MLTSLIATRHAAPARPGKGAEPINDPASLAEYRAQLLRHPVITRAPTEAVVKLLLEHVRFVTYRAGYAVMSAGEPGDRLGWVLAGRCEVVEAADPSTGRSTQRVGWVGPDELIGEMSLLSDAPRRQTVVASRDTVIAEVPFAALDRHEDPLHRLALRGWLGEVAARRMALGAAQRPRDMTLTVAPLTVDAGPAFAERLAETLRVMGDTCLVVERSHFDGLPSPLDLSRLERAHSYVIYVATGTDSAWDALTVRQGDRLLLVADASADPRLHKLDLMTREALATRMLVLLHPGETIADTARWLEPRPKLFHVHVRRGIDGDLRRCARLATGRGRGVVFAGASSQGVGYAGMAAAFEEVGFVPDVVTGNSSGALAAAQLAALRPAAEIAQVGCATVAALRPSLWGSSLPVVALSDGKSITRFMQETFGDAQMEDLPLPCLVTAVDLSSLALRDLERGPVWRAVRASMSLPIIYPPVVDDGVLVDGGTLENYPVDQIAGLCAQGRILICDLSQDIPPMEDITDYGAAIGGISALARRLKPFGQRDKLPALGDIVFRVMCLASDVHRRNVMARRADHWTMVRPTIDAPGLFSVDAEKQAALLEACRAYTRALLDEMPDLHEAPDA